VQLEAPPLPIERVNGGVQRSTRIDDQEIASRQPAREISESCVLDGIVLEVRHEQPYCVTRESASFRRFAGFERGAEDGPLN
jgi:hypothetical protein